jgi:2-oxoglutarate dehydrogenase E1 component
MAWFRAGASIAKHAIKRTLSQRGGCGGSSYLVSRARFLPSTQGRNFHTTVFKNQAAPVPRAVPLSKLTDSFLDGTSSVDKSFLI